METPFNLGRLYSPDERDRMFLMSSLLPERVKVRTFKYWHPGFWWGDQKNTPHCVGFSWVHWLAEGSLTQQKSRNANNGRPFDPDYLYRESQKVDEWDGTNYEGTSVRAGAKVLMSNGFISSYNWAWNIEDVINALLYTGPVVVGTVWKYDMFFPDSKGLIKATGSDAGGHAYLLDGINVKKGIIRIKNSWGRRFGKKGFAYISIDDMAKLISLNGEACLAVEINK